MNNHKFKATIKLFLVSSLFVIAHIGCASVSSTNTPTNIAIVQTETISSGPVASRTQSVSPQGSLIFSCWDGIYRYTIENNTIVPLTADTTRLYLDVNVYGDWVYFLRTTDLREQEFPSGGGHGPNDVFRVKLDGTVTEQVTKDDYYDLNLIMLPTNHKLVYVSDRIAPDHSPNRYKVVVLNLDTKIEEVVLENSESLLLTGSPKEDKVALLETPALLEEKRKLSVLDLKTNLATELIPNQEMVSGRPSWSPDGNNIVLGIKENVTFNIIFVDVAAKEIVNTIAISDEPRNFVWSPNGKMILYETRTYLSETDVLAKLWLFNTSSEEVTLLYEGGLDGRFFSYNAIWSPDSKFFAYFTYSDNGNLSLHIQNSKTSEEFLSKIPCSFVGSVIWATSTK